MKFSSISVYSKWRKNATISSTIRSSLYFFFIRLSRVRATTSASFSRSSNQSIFTGAVFLLHGYAFVTWSSKRWIVSVVVLRKSTLSQTSQNIFHWLYTQYSPIIRRKVMSGTIDRQSSRTRRVSGEVDIICRINLDKSKLICFLLILEITIFLHIHHLSINFGYFIKLFMWSIGNNLAMIHEDNLISMHDCWESMRNNNTGSSFHQMIKCILYLPLCLGIESARCFIEDEYLRIRENRSSDS